MLRDRIRGFLDVIFMFPYGFSSGLPLALTGTTLQAWFTVKGVDIVTLGFVPLIGIPYSIKFLWAPLMDLISLPLLSRRRGWILVTQLLLSISLFTISIFNPKEHLQVMIILAFLIAFLSASQDISIDAYRSDILSASNRGLGVATFITGYRLAMITSGGLALMLADFIGWDTTYRLMAGIMLAMICFTVISPVEATVNMSEKASNPFLYPFTRLFIDVGLMGLLFVVIYKIGDAFSGALTTPFFIRKLGFTAAEVGFLNKIIGIVSTIAGAFLGGFLMSKIGLYKSLLLFGILQGVTNLGFFLLIYLPKDLLLASVVIVLENLSGGMGTAAFLSVLMAFCDSRYSAAQFAILSSISSLGRIFIAPLTGFIVDSYGWGTFYISSFLVSLPGIFIIPLIRGKIEDKKGEST